MPLYVVVDDTNYWSVYGHFDYEVAQEKMIP
jgi:hypothetical protein